MFFAVKTKQMDFTEYCNELNFTSPEYKNCACWNALLVNRNVFLDMLAQLSEYERQNALYIEYTKEKSDWANRRAAYQANNLDGIRWQSQCMAGVSKSSREPAGGYLSTWPVYCEDHDPNMYSADNPTMRRDCNGDFGSKLVCDAVQGVPPCNDDYLTSWQSICRYNPTYIQQQMADWDKQYPPPQLVQEPRRPAQVELTDIECCDQSFKNIKADSIDFNNVFQNCQLQITNKIATSQNVNIPSLPPITSVPTSVPTSAPTSAPNLLVLWIVLGVVGVVAVIGLLTYLGQKLSE